MDDLEYPLKDEILEVIHDPGLVDKACAPLRRVLDHILSSLDGRKPIWMGIHSVRLLLTP